MLRRKASPDACGATLDALVHTAPVGVVIFDAATGDVLSINQECKRIVEGLRTPGHTSEQMLEVISFRRVDGREVDLARTTLADALQSGETVRGEEVRLSTPDGRNATILIDTAPVQSADGAIERVIVTMQDLAPIQELERLRSEFLGMVSHELRAPLTSIKGSAATLLETASDLDLAVIREFHRIIATQAAQMNGLINDLLDAGRIDAGMLCTQRKMVERSTGDATFRRHRFEVAVADRVAAVPAHCPQYDLTAEVTSLEVVHGPAPPPAIVDSSPFRVRFATEPLSFGVPSGMSTAHSPGGVRSTPRRTPSTMASTERRPARENPPRAFRPSRSMWAWES